MKLVNQLKDNLTRRKMRQLDNKAAQQRAFVDLDKAKNIGMIVNMNDCDTDEIKQLKKYVTRLKKDKKQIYIIELNFVKKSEPELTQTQDGIFVSPSQMNWLDYPVPTVENKIKEQKLDILMNFDISEKMTAKYILTFASAKTRTGPHLEGFEEFYELMVNLPQTTNGKYLSAMINQFDYFLKMIEK